MPETPNMNSGQPASPSRRWRRFQLKARLFHGPLVIVPLLNVFLLIFLFAIFNSAFVLKPGINLQLPVGVFKDGAFYNSAVVILTQEGMVFYNDERLSLESLGEAFRALASKKNAPQLAIEADLRVPYDSIIRVLNMAATTGMSNIYLSVRPTFGEELMP